MNVDISVDVLFMLLPELFARMFVESKSDSAEAFAALMILFHVMDDKVDNGLGSESVFPPKKCARTQAVHAEIIHQWMLRYLPRMALVGSGTNDKRVSVNMKKS